VFDRDAICERRKQTSGHEALVLCVSSTAKHDIWNPRLLFSAQTVKIEATAHTSTPEGSLEVPIVCESLRTKVLQACEHFWGAWLGDAAVLADDSPQQRSEAAATLPFRCQGAFTAIWGTAGSSFLNYGQKFFLLAPLLAKALADGFLAYGVQMFWSGFSWRLGTRVWVDKLAAYLGAEDVEFSRRPLGALLRSGGVWKMEGSRPLSSGACSAGRFKGHGNFWTWVSNFFGSLTGAAPRTYILVNYGETKLKGSFLWNYETSSMAEVCLFNNARPSVVVVDLQNNCGSVVDDFFSRLQSVAGVWKDDVDLGLDCASKGTGCLKVKQMEACNQCGVWTFRPLSQTDFNIL